MQGLRPGTLPAGHADDGDTATLAAPGPAGRPPTLLLPLLSCSSPSAGRGLPRGAHFRAFRSESPDDSLQSMAWPSPAPTCWRGTVAEEEAEQRSAA